LDSLSPSPNKIIVESIKVSKVLAPFYSSEDTGDPFNRYITKQEKENKDTKFNIEETYESVQTFKQKMINLGVIDRYELSLNSNLIPLDIFGEEPKVITPDNFTLETYLNPNDFTGLIGMTESGKTLLAYTFAICLATGKDFMDFRVSSPHKVLYFDSETGQERARNYIHRIKNAYECDEKEMERNLFMQSLKERSQMGPKTVAPIDLINSDFQKEIIDEVEAHRAEYIFFDNIKTLGKNLILPANWHKVLDFFNVLSKGQRSIIYCHHLDDNLKIMGTSDIKNLSQNVLLIYGNKIVKKDFTNLDGRFKPMDCVMKLSYEKSKSYIGNKEKIQVWKLEYIKEDSLTGGKWECLYSSDQETPIDKTADMNDELYSKAIEIFTNRLGRDPLKKGKQKVNTDWKEDVLLIFAIKRFIKNINSPTNQWFSVSDIPDGLIAKNINTNKKYLKNLVQKSLLDFQGETSQKGQKGHPFVWRYRHDETEDG
jgi:hypothetical protein